MENIIEVQNLSKTFKDVKAVNDISFNVEKGSMFAFLGVNGAGKSTTINILSTILKKDYGKVFIDNFDIDKDFDKIKSEIGIVFQDSVLDSRLNVLSNLYIRGSYYGLQKAALENRVDELVALFNLNEIKKRPYGKLSGGQRRRVDIARALINKPKLLFLDEPTTGLDPQTRIMVWDIIKKLRDETDLTVFLTTHYMEETVNADKVVILDNGKIVASDTPNKLKNFYTKDYVKWYTKQISKSTEWLNEQNLDFEYKSNAYIIKFLKFENAKQFILNNSKTLVDFELIKGDMDDVFLNVTGKNLKNI